MNPYQVSIADVEAVAQPLEPSKADFPLGLWFPVGLGVIYPACMVAFIQSVERPEDWLVGAVTSFLLCFFGIGAVLPGTFEERLKVGLVMAMVAVVSPVIFVPACMVGAVATPYGVGALLAFPLTFGILGVYVRRYVRGRETRKQKLVQIEQSRIEAIQTHSSEQVIR